MRHEPRVPLRNGERFRFVGARPVGTVCASLAVELRRVLDRFAHDAGFDAACPVRIGLRPGIVGHHQRGRAVDIDAVGPLGIDEWKRRWDAALARAAALGRDERRACLARARRTNLGWRLYRALQAYGRWAQPYGYPIQLFGPWTRDEGPWRFIGDRLLRAHRDHIHVAK